MEMWNIFLVNYKQFLSLKTQETSTNIFFLLSFQVSLWNVCGNIKRNIEKWKN